MNDFLLFFQKEVEIDKNNFSIFPEIIGKSN